MTGCGRRSCGREAAVSWTQWNGSIRTRCDVHALADGVDGVGESKAETIIDAVDLEELVDRCEDADGTHAPPIISRLDGFGPTSAADVAEAIDQSGVASAIRDRQEGDR